MKKILVACFIFIILILGFYLSLLYFGDTGSTLPPDPSRFQKVELATGLDEPMELAILPDSNVLLIERKGAIECRAGSIDGKIISVLEYEPSAKGNINMDASKKNQFIETSKIPIQLTEGVHDLYFVFKDLSEEVDTWNAFELTHINFHK